MSIIKSISISDIHIGHTKTKPSVIHANLTKYLYPQLTIDVDILIISGDFFDALLDMNGNAGFIAATIIDEIKTICRTNGIYIRVLRGTFTHDRYQNQFFNVRNSDERIGKDLAVRVFNSITVEWIEELSISVLYVPDDLPHEDPLIAIRECIRDSSYNKVDMASMHCYFDHLLPAGIPRKPHNCYDANDIIELVHGPVFNGHIHHKCVHKTIFTNGSFDRLAHGEEGQKGYFKVEYDTESKSVTYDFIVNEGATIYKSIILGHGDHNIDDFPNLVNEILETSKSSSDIYYIRVVSDNSEVKKAAHEYITSNFENVFFSAKQFSKTNDSKDGDIHIPTIEELPTITEDTLPSMVVEFAKVKLGKTITEEVVRKELK